MENIFKSITERLVSLDPSLVIHNEGSWSGTTSHYSAFNDAGVECEVGEFLYALTRLIKPNNVLETGTHKGIGASYIGMGLQDNGFGKLDTIEFLEPNFKEAVARIIKLGLKDKVQCHFGDVKEFRAPTNYQLILLDTEPQTRFAELVKFYPKLDEGGFIFIHDLHRHMGQTPNSEHGFAWPWGLVDKNMQRWVRQSKLRPFHFSTPRGLTGFYKVHSEDYPWARD
jgi:predicted O-methyltransferase YrrM